MEKLEKSNIIADDWNVKEELNLKKLIGMTYYTISELTQRKKNLKVI